MPKFIDYHDKMPTLPPEKLAKMKQAVGRTDQGVTMLNAHLTKDGHAYCMTEASNVDAVCKAHEAMGIPVRKEDVHEISSSLA